MAVGLQSFWLGVAGRSALPEGIGNADVRFERVDIAGSHAERPMYLLIHPERARIPTVVRTATWVEDTIRLWNAKQY